MEDETIEKLNKFFAEFKPIRYEKGETILRAEDIPSGVSFVRRGFVRLYSVSEEGKELTLNIYKPGTYFPMTWAIGDMPNVYFYEAMTDVEISRVPKEKVIQFLKGQPKILFELTRRIVVGLETTLTRIQYLLYGDAESKVASAVLLLVKRFGKKERKGIVIGLPFTHSDIASLAGLTRETTSLEMEKLEKGGLIIKENRLIFVKDIQKLQEKAFIYLDEKPLPYTF